MVIQANEVVGLDLLSHANSHVVVIDAIEVVLFALLQTTITV